MLILSEKYVILEKKKKFFRNVELFLHLDCLYIQIARGGQMNEEVLCMIFGKLAEGYQLTEDQQKALFRKIIEDGSSLENEGRSGLHRSGGESEAR